MNEVLKTFIIKMNHYNKLVDIKTLTDKTFEDVKTGTNEVDKLLNITITEPKDLLELDFTQPLALDTELVLYKPDNADNYDKIVKLFEVSGGDANKFIKEKFDNAQKPLLFLALDICVFNYSGSYFLTNDLKKLKHEKVTKKQTSPFFTKTAEAGAKSPEPDASESEMQKAYIKVKRLCKEITDGAFKDIAKEAMWTVWKDKNIAPFYKTHHDYFTKLSETLDLKNKMKKHIESDDSDYIVKILGTKTEEKYDLKNGIGTGSIFELDTTIFNFFTQKLQSIEDSELRTYPKYFTEATTLLEFAKEEEKKNETFKDNVTKFTEQTQKLVEAVNQLIELQKKFIAKHQNEFFKEALEKFEKVIIKTLTAELELPTTIADAPYKESIKKELKEAQTKIEEKKTMLKEEKKVENPKLTEAQQKLETAKAKFLDAKEEQRLAKVALEAATMKKTSMVAAAAVATGGEKAAKEAAAAAARAAIAEAAIAAAAAAAADEAVKAADAELKAAEAELKAAEAALTALTAPIAVGGSIQIGGDDFATKYAEFQALKTEIAPLDGDDNPIKKDYPASEMNNSSNIIAIYKSINAHILKFYDINDSNNYIARYRSIVNAIKDNAEEINKVRKIAICDYIGTLIDMFIKSATKLDKVYKSIDETTRNTHFNIKDVEARDTDGKESIRLTIESLVLANTEIIDIYKSIKDSVSETVKINIEPIWIDLTNLIHDIAINRPDTGLDFYKQLVQLYINTILMSQMHRQFDTGSTYPIYSIILYFYEMIVGYTHEFYEPRVMAEFNAEQQFIYSAVLESLHTILQYIIFFQTTNNHDPRGNIHFFNNDFKRVQAFIKKLPLDKVYQTTLHAFIEAFIEKLIEVTADASALNKGSPIFFLNIMLTAIFFISNYKIQEAKFNALKENLKKINLRLEIPLAARVTKETILVTLVKKCCTQLEPLAFATINTLSRAYGVNPVNLVDTSIGVATAATPPPPHRPATATTSSVFIISAQDKIDIEATFFTLLMFYASYDFSIDKLIVEKFRSKFVENKFEIKPFLLFDSGEFDIIKKIKTKGSDFDPHVFDLEKESLQLFHVGSIGSLWDYANGKLTILLYNMLQISSYKELLKRKYNSNKLFLFECINALKHFKAHILQPGKSSTITFAMSTLKAIEILLVKLSFILNAFESKFIAADSVIFQVTINGMPANYTINSPYEVTSLTISSGSPSLTPRTAADADAVRLEAEAVRLEAEAVRLEAEAVDATADAKRLADEARIAAKDVGLETPPLTARGAPEVVGGGTTDLTGHDDTHAYRVATPDYLPLYHKKTENDDHTRQMHTTEIKLPIISTKSSKTQSKERGTKKEPSVRRKKKASSRYTNKIKKILTRVFR